MAQITNELTLNDGFTYKIKSVLYDWDLETVSIEVIFKEGAYPHSRSFEFPATQGMMEANINALINQQIWAKKGRNI